MNTIPLAPAPESNILSPASTPTTPSQRRRPKKLTSPQRSRTSQAGLYSPEAIKRKATVTDPIKAAIADPANNLPF